MVNSQTVHSDNGTLMGYNGSWWDLYVFCSVMSPDVANSVRWILTRQWDSVIIRDAGKRYIWKLEKVEEDKRSSQPKTLAKCVING